MSDEDLPRQYVVAPNGLPSPLLTHMMNKRRNAESKAPCANHCEAQAFKIENRMQESRIAELEAMLRAQNALIEDLQKALREVPSTQLQYADHIRRQHEAIKQLRGTLETISNYVGKSNPPSRIWVRAEKALKDTEDLA